MPSSETAIETKYAVAELDTKPGAYSFRAETPSDPASNATNSVTSEPIIRSDASPLPCRNDRFGRPYTMLNADSRTLKRESDVQSNAAPPTIQSAVALSCTVWTRLMMQSTGVPGSVCLISLTRNDDSSARPVRPRRDRERNINGTKESRAK